MLPTTPLSQALVSQPFKRAQLGLFQGKTRLSGNNVPFSKHKTRRTWLPNVQRKRLPSEALQKTVTVKLTTRALRTIKKHGGIDNYVMKMRSELLGLEGMDLRLKIKNLSKYDGEFGQSPEEEARQILETLLATKGWGAAAAERERVAMNLGLDSLPSAEQTIAYLKQERQEMADLAKKLEELGAIMEKEDALQQTTA